MSKHWGLMQGTFCLTVLTSIAPAWAINKCTGPDGKVLYQDAPCDVATRTSEPLKTWDGRASSEESWRFAKQTDEMTGERGCFAVSPSTMTNVRPGYTRYSTVWMQLYMAPQTEQIHVTVRTRTEGSDIFHSVIDGTGVKVDRHEFVPFSVRAQQHALGFTQGASDTALVRQMENGQGVRLRLRFWPYDRVHDTDAIPLVGIKQALSSLRSCAKV